MGFVPDELDQWAESVGREMNPEFSGATFRQLRAQRPDLAMRVAERFVRRFLDEAHLSDHRFDEALRMLVVEEGTTPLGHSLLRVTFPFMGTTSTQEWDGTDEEAEEALEALAASLAEDVEGDRSMVGLTGWEREFDEP